MGYTPVSAGGNATPTSPNPFSGTTGLGLTLDKKSLNLPVKVHGAVTPKSGSPLDVGLAIGQSNSTASVKDLLNLFIHSDFENVEKVQRDLYDAGFYPRGYYSGTNPKDVPFGSVDDDTVKAYARFLLEAARTQRPVDEVLAQHKKVFDAQATASLVRRPVQIEATNPEDLRYTFDHIVRIRLGRKDDALVNDMLFKYLSLEADYQQKAQAMEGPIGHPELATPGTVTKPPDASAFAEAQIQQQRPGAAAASAIGEQAKNLESILHG